MTFDEIEADVRAAPAELGTVRLIVRRPAVDAREVVEQARLDVGAGLVGDTWQERGSSSMPGGSADPAAQVTVMSARVATALAGDVDRWPLAGDQLYVDFDISEGNLPPGTRLRVGEAELEVSAKPHTGCAKFSARFGVEALRMVSSPTGQSLRLRGMNTRVATGGVVRVGDAVEIVAAS